jgi:hypothetical protein
MTSSATTATYGWRANRHRIAMPGETVTHIEAEVLSDRVLTTSGAAVAAQRRSQRVRTTACVLTASRTATHRTRRRYLVGNDRPL